MYILNNNIRYECNEYKVISSDEIRFSLTTEPTNITGQIKLYSDDEEPILLASINSDAFTISVIKNSETEYILTLNIFISEVVTLENAKTRKINKLDTICENTIQAGMDIQLSTGVRKFTLDDHDQLNLTSIGFELLMGATQVSWHIDDEAEHCEYFSNTDALLIINTLSIFKKYHITYFRDLRIYIRDMTSVEDVNNAYYGMQIPDEYKSQVLKDFEIQIAAITENINSGDTDETNTETTV